MKMQSWLFQERSYITLHFINLTTKMLSVISVSGKHCFTTDWFDGSWLDHGFSSVCCYWYWLHSSWQRRCLNTQTKITHKTCDRVLWVHSYRSLHIWMGCFSWVYNVTSLVNTTHLSLFNRQFLKLKHLFSPRTQQWHIIYWYWNRSPENIAGFSSFCL